MCFILTMLHLCDLQTTERERIIVAQLLSVQYKLDSGFGPLCTPHGESQPPHGSEMQDCDVIIVLGGEGTETYRENMSLLNGNVRV